MRRPSQRTIDIYNQLVEKQNQVRKTLIRVHKRAEETQGAGRLPALVIPKKARKVRFSDFNNSNKYFRKALRKARMIAKIKAFWKSYKEKMGLFGKGLTSYIARTVKDGYMELWRDQILFLSGEAPAGVANKFTREQIQGSFMGNFMETYNKLQAMSPLKFLVLLYKGDLLQFKYIYQEMAYGEKEQGYLWQQNELLEKNKSLRVTLADVDNMIREKPDYEHKQKTIRRAESLQRRARK